MDNVFTYGTLMYNSVWSLVVRGNYRKTPGVIRGFVRKKVRGATYPAVYPGPEQSMVEGMIYFEVEPNDLLRLDAFEGVYYKRKALRAYLPDGLVCDVWGYVFKNEYRHLTSIEDWDPDWFSTVGLKQFIYNYKGFRELD